MAAFKFASSFKGMKQQSKGTLNENLKSADLSQVSLGAREEGNKKYRVGCVSSVYARE